MTRNVDDVHSFETGFIRAKERIENAGISQRNKDLINRFIVHCRREGLKKSTITTYVNFLRWMIEKLEKIGYTKDIDELEQDDFDEFLIYLEDEEEASPGTIRNYKKVTKKFFRFLTDDDVPKWVRKLKLGQVETHIQPQDLPDSKDIDKMIEVCTNARNRAIVATLYDGGFRPGALASCRVGSVESNQYSSIIYLPRTSKARKTTPPKGIPLTWASGYLQQWLAVHPLKDDPYAPLWVTLDKNQTALSYNTFRKTIKDIAVKAGIKKRFYPYLFRHKAVTNWILDGYNEQEIKHRAGWSKGSTRMFQVYANFTDQEINDRIYEKCGLKTEDKRHITLKKCPRCSSVLKPNDRFCSQCSLVLDHQAQDEIGKYEAKLPEILQMIMQSEKAREMLANIQKEV
ncbi:tyrosine-type recombinase/integrase [Methanolobus vulcani]|uniref:Tyrosine-type recombinase/integrase n=1 Tax=Methanolobus vulcani TaxID=38026 RepID=A0A7Z8KRM6_9EURY|nr:tyrosine-type recombinase/integrase [Methanolobus vulcani]TQD28263.1 tyrosine-type recombinase/integrase [Methanolobus vulcani]